MSKRSSDKTSHRIVGRAALALFTLRQASYFFLRLPALNRIHLDFAISKSNSIHTCEERSNVVDGVLHGIAASRLKFE